MNAAATLTTIDTLGALPFVRVEQVTAPTSVFVGCRMIYVQDERKDAFLRINVALRVDGGESIGVTNELTGETDTMTAMEAIGLVIQASNNARRDAARYQQLCDRRAW